MLNIQSLLKKVKKTTKIIEIQSTTSKPAEEKSEIKNICKYHRK